MMQKAKTTRIPAGFLRMGLVALLVGLIAFSVYQLAQHISAGAQTLRTQSITDSTYMQMDLYLFRDEEVLTVPGDGRLFVYHVGDGEKVGVGHTVASAYLGALSDDQGKLAQDALNTYGQQIALIRQHVGNGQHTDVDEALQSLDRQYLGMLAAVDQGQLAVADGFAQQMAEAMNRYRVLTAAAEAADDTLERLQSEQAAVVAECAKDADVILGDGGYFYYETDGYESVFAYEQVMTMTPEQFLEMTRSEGTEPPMGSTVGKLVKTSTWYGAAYVTAEEAAYLEEGRTYHMSCRNSAGTQITMTVCRMQADETGTLVVFETQSMPTGFSYDRRLSVQMVSASVSGYRVPESAVIKRVGESGVEEEGVYILVGNVVEYRRILTRGTYEGYRIVLTQSEVTAYLEELGQSGAGTYLALNDLILLSPDGLNEGDMLK